ncbi:MAG: glycosyltransferase [Chitinispirillales bacterium]|jgi:glycosyltransferase involved in cell wall biosynthesis|nr:glycosyltransferase [Chitinispirillales bacterium]
MERLDLLKIIRNRLQKMLNLILPRTIDSHITFFKKENLCENKKNMTISIVTPCYNSGKYLEETILSVLQQNYPNLEYIIIDGGSTDNSLDIIKKYQDKLTYWVSEKDNGMYDAIQKGFEKSTGEIMAWINADDMYHKNSFYIVSEIFSKYQNVDWLVGAMVTFDECSRGVGVTRSKKFTKYDFLSGDFKWIQQESCFFRRCLWKKAGGYVDCSLRYAGDFELWLRFFRHGRLYVVDALLGGFRMRTSNQLSLEGMLKYLEEATNAIKKERGRRIVIFKIARYKIIFGILSTLSKLFMKIAEKYRQLEFNTSENIVFNRNTQTFEIK